MLPVTLIGAGVTSGRYIEVIDDCPHCHEVATIFCSTCGLCLDCCECDQGDCGEEWYGE